ncbi:MAG: D-alanyl-D-alanine carboxypeptidase family protein [Pseudomonadota bacterium]
MMISPNGMLSSFAAGPAILFDAKTGHVLYAEDENRLWYPASLTKMMTAYIVFEDLRDGKITEKEYIISSPLAHKQPPSKIGLPIGGQMSVKLALETLIVKSANDVAVMLAEKISGDFDTFVNRMNTTAKKLGMTNTRFFNPNGLPDGRQVTTARDMALLTKAIIHDFPQHAELFLQKHVRIGKKRLRSHNDLLRTYTGTDGMKTGFICASGFNVVASASRDNTRLVAVVLGARSSLQRRKRAMKLFNHGFNYHKWKAIFTPQKLDELTQEDLRGPKNMRRRLASWSCRNRRRRTKIKKNNKKVKVNEKSKQGAEESKPQEKSKTQK